MPELPEIETIRLGLEPELPGRSFTAAKVVRAEALALPDPAAFERQLPGHTIAKLGRHGKFLLIHLTDGCALVVHLRMTGRLLLREPGAPPDQPLSVWLQLDDGRELRYTDVRRFGRLWLVEDWRTVVVHCGPDAFDQALGPPELAARLAGRAAPIKSLLLDQRILAGVGNIYADETLHQVGIHPRRPAGSLSADEVARLLDAVRAVMRASVGNGGTTFSWYRDAWGRRGENESALRVYDRDGQPCLTCGTAIARLVLSNRSAHYCPRCQPL